MGTTWGALSYERGQAIAYIRGPTIHEGKTGSSQFGV